MQRSFEGDRAPPRAPPPTPPAPATRTHEPGQISSESRPRVLIRFKLKPAFFRLARFSGNFRFLAENVIGLNSKIPDDACDAGLSDFFRSKINISNVR